MSYMAVIPARLSSTRLENKPLQLINGKPLIVHVAEEVLKTKVFDQVCVATDSQKIIDLFKGHEVKAVMTSPDHESGTDRINEVVEKTDVDVVFNIQGDEPFIYKEDLVLLKAKMQEGCLMSSLYETLHPEELDNLNKVKVILNDYSEAMYFSRLGIPFSRADKVKLNSKYIGKHIGVYAYKKEFLKEFCKAEIGYHESFEKLEQLRALQMGVSIKMVHTKNKYQGVDTKEDLEKVNEILKKRE